MPWLLVMALAAAGSFLIARKRKPKAYEVLEYENGRLLSVSGYDGYSNAVYHIQTISRISALAHVFVLRQFDAAQYRMVFVGAWYATGEEISPAEAERIIQTAA